MIRPENAHHPGAVPEELLSSLRHGINIQGWTLWHEPTLSAAEMQRMRGDGFDHIRLYFDARASDADLTDYPAALDRDWLIAKADETIANALAAGLKVIVNPTPEIRPEDTPAEIAGHIDALGSYAAHIARKFGTGDIVLETTNEPSFPTQAAWADVEARLIAAVRAASPDMTIMATINLISDGDWWQLGGLEDSLAHHDGKTLYSAHSYFPTVFTGQEGGVSHWPEAPGHTAGAGIIDWYYREGFASEAALLELADAFARIADARGMTLHMGEFGAIASAPAEARLAYLEAASGSFERHGLGWTVWQSHGTYGIYDRTADGLEATDPALPAALGLGGERPEEPLTVTFAAAAARDPLSPWSGPVFLPGPGEELTLGQAELGAGAAAGASVSLLRDGAGALSVTNLGPRFSAPGLGIEDDAAGAVTASGFERTWVSLGNGSGSTVAIETMHHRIITGDGPDRIAVTTWSPATAAVAGGGHISSGAGDDIITIDASRAAGHLGGPAASVSAWAGAGNDRIVIGGGAGGLFSGGSGDDWIVSGTGDEDLRGDVGIDTLVLPGLRQEWRFTALEDALGPCLAASGPGGNDTLRGFEWVVFGDGAVSRFGELWGDRAPEGVGLVAAWAGEAAGVVARAVATDPEGGPLTFFLSDSAGGRFGIDPYSGEVSLRPGITVHAGETYRVGVGVVDAAGNVSGAMLPLEMAGTIGDDRGSSATPAVASVSFRGGAGSAQGRASPVDAASARILAGGGTALPDIAPDARAALVADASGAATISVLSAWNSIKDVTVRDDDGGRLTIRNAVNVDVEATGAAALSLTVIDAKRGTITTGAGNDIVTISAVANSSDGTLFRIDTGAGNDRITLESASSWTEAVIDAGAGDDTILAGPGDDEIRGGSGTDTLLLPGLRDETGFSAGSDAAGRFIRASGPGGTDTLRDIEFVTFADGARYRVGELLGHGTPLAIVLDQAATAGVLATARAIGTGEAADLTWAIADAAASPFRIDPVTGAITAKPGVPVPHGAVHGLDLVVTDPWGGMLAAPVMLHTAPPRAMVTLGNAIAASPADLRAGAWSGEAGEARVLTADDLAALDAIAADARVLIAESDAGVTEVSVLSAWNSVKTVIVEDSDGGAVHIANAVHAWFIGSGSAAAALTVTDAKRADIRTGEGDDVISVQALSNGAGEGNAVVVSAGAGNDRVMVTGDHGMTVAHLAGGAGDDVLGFTGAGEAVFDGGAGADVMVGGTGHDRFVLRPGEVAGDRIEAFQGVAAAGGDRLALEGFGTDAALIHLGGGLWRVDYLAGGIAASETFEVAGVTALGTEDVIWG